MAKHTKLWLTHSSNSTGDGNTGWARQAGPPTRQNRAGWYNQPSKPSPQNPSTRPVRGRVGQRQGNNTSGNLFLFLFILFNILEWVLGSTHHFLAQKSIFLTICLYFLLWHGRVGCLLALPTVTYNKAAKGEAQSGSFVHPLSGKKKKVFFFLTLICSIPKEGTQLALFGSVSISSSLKSATDLVVASNSLADTLVSPIES